MTCLAGLEFEHMANDEHKSDSLKSGREFMQDQAAIVSKSWKLPRYTLSVSVYVKRLYHIAKFSLLYVPAWSVLVHYPPSSRFQNQVFLR